MPIKPNQVDDCGGRRVETQCAARFGRGQVGAGKRVGRGIANAARTIVEASIGEVGVAKIRARKVGIYEIRFYQILAGEVRAGEGG
jgi:hypothetical protein